MSENKTIPFIEDIENADYSQNFTYLLNFWHTTKINKENEFIKRNGLHPALINSTGVNLFSAQSTNDVNVSEGNSIQTNFYTVFRMFLERLFGDAKALKVRDVEQWGISLKPEASALDIKNFLLVYYAQKAGMEGGAFVFPYATNAINKFTVSLNIKDQLHSKRILDALNDYESDAKSMIDSYIKDEMDSIVRRLKHDFGLEEIETKVKAKIKKTKRITTTGDIVLDFEGRQGGWQAYEARTAGTPTPVPNNPNSERIRLLLPTYQQLADSLIMFDDRTKFRFVLNYAKTAGTNPIINQIDDNETNYRTFINLRNAA